MWKTIEKTGRVFLILLGISWFALGACYKQHVAPPEHVRTLRDFLAEMPAPAQAEIFDRGDKEYLRLTGPVDLWAMLAVKSGPPAYVFDGSAKLADWTADVGDDGAFNERWEGFKVRSIDMGKAMNWGRERN